MKHILFVFTVLIPLMSFGQAKKPIIMVVPSDRYCISKNYSLTFEGQTLPDYKKTFQNDENARLVITKMGQIMADRGFTLKDLETALKDLEKEAAEVAMLTSKGGSDIQESPIDKLKNVAKADIILDLDFSIKKDGPEKYISFNLRGLDAYTSKQISGAAGDGQPSFSSTPGELLMEAVLNHMDGFNAQLMKHFEDMFENGREVKIVVRKFESSDVDLESEVNYKGNDVELVEVINYWLEDNCIKGRYSNTDMTANVAKYEQVRIPMMKFDARGKESALDTRTFVGELQKYLKKEYGIESKNYGRGLGEGWLILGEK